MLNLAQRLILGCVLLAALTLGLVAAAHHALAAAGQLGLAWAIVAASIVVEIATVFFVLQSIAWPATPTRSPAATWSTAPSGAAATTLA